MKGIRKAGAVAVSVLKGVLTFAYAVALLLVLLVVQLALAAVRVLVRRKKCAKKRRQRLLRKGEPLGAAGQQSMTPLPEMGTSAVGKGAEYTVRQRNT